MLTDVYTQFAGGGGAAKIDVPAVLTEMRALADRQGNLFRLPPYFAYIARAFSVLEGIGLKNDPDYAIVGECLPYVSQRLLSDPSPRVAKALETFVYGGDDQLVKKVDADRLTYLADGLQSYSKSETGNQVDVDVLDCVEINQCARCTRQFFTKSFLGDGAAVLARSSGEEPTSPRHRAGVASMACR